MKSSKFIICLACALMMSCASTGLNTTAVEAKPEASYLALSLSHNEGSSKYVTVTDSSGVENQFKMGEPAVRLADEDVYFFEVDPKKTYAMTAIMTGSYRTILKDLQIEVAPAKITYLGSLMLWETDGRWSDAIVTKATPTSAVSEQLKKKWPNRNFIFGFRK